MDCRAKDGEMRRVHRETVDVLARFGRDGRLEPCAVVLKDCRAFRIDEVLMASGFGPVHHGKRTARFNIRLGGRKRSCSWSISWKTPPRVRRINMYGGCALSMEQSEVPLKAAADSLRGAGECCGLRIADAANAVGRAPRARLELRHLAGATGATGAAAYRVRLTPRRCSAPSGRGKIRAPCMI